MPVISSNVYYTILYSQTIFGSICLNKSRNPILEYHNGNLNAVILKFQPYVPSRISNNDDVAQYEFRSPISKDRTRFPATTTSSWFPLGVPLYELQNIIQFRSAWRSRSVGGDTLVFDAVPIKPPEKQLVNKQRSHIETECERDARATNDTRVVFVLQQPKRRQHKRASLLIG